MRSSLFAAVLAVVAAAVIPARAGSPAEVEFSPEQVQEMGRIVKAMESTRLAPLRAAFAAARRPRPEDLKARTSWRCYAVLNKRGNPIQIDELSFDSFGGTVLSTQRDPARTLNYEDSERGLRASWRTGRNNVFGAVAAFRVDKDGSLLREVSLIWPGFPLYEPAGFARLQPLGMEKSEYGRLGSGREATVYSYARCSPPEPR